MYTVAISINHYNRTYSLTCRDLKRSPHWQSQGGDVWSIRDTRETEEAGYELAGYTRELVKVVDGLAV
jgi:hypothetical protein